MYFGCATNGLYRCGTFQSKQLLEKTAVNCLFLQYLVIAYHSTPFSFLDMKSRLAFSLSSGGPMDGLLHLYILHVVVNSYFLLPISIINKYCLLDNVLCSVYPLLGNNSVNTFPWKHTRTTIRRPLLGNESVNTPP
jgi:hypothetical protein